MSRFISPPTNKMYLRYARSAHFKPESVPLGNGAQGHWIGDKNAKNVLIWYHGQYFAGESKKSKDIFMLIFHRRRVLSPCEYRLF